MPSFRPFGFTDGLPVTCTVSQNALTATASLTAWNTPPVQGTASFTIAISMQELPELVAPCGLFFTVTNIQGFAVEEPASNLGNVYDPTAEQITWIWGFGDQPYTPLITPNIPTEWRNTNIGYGKRVGHVYNQAGNYVVECFGVDREGNTHTAYFNIGGSNANIPRIATPAEAYPGSRTIVCAPGYATSDADAPAGCQFATSFANAITRLRDLGVTGRILNKYGATYTDWAAFGPLTPSRNFRLDAYGNPALGLPKIIADQTWGFSYGNSYNPTSSDSLIINHEFIGPYDATTETGLNVPFLQTSRPQGNYMFHRCKISGFRACNPHDNYQLADGPITWIFSDTEITNWQNYGVYAAGVAHQGGHFAIIGCDFHQHEDALNGLPGIQGAGLGMGNQHTGFRFQYIATLYLSCSSFFNRCGWSSNGGRDDALVPPSGEQPAIRYMMGAETAPGVALEPIWAALKVVHNTERCSLEGGGEAVIRISNQQRGVQPALPGNYIFDKVLFAASSNTSRFIEQMICGTIFRNCFFYAANVARSRLGGFDQIVNFYPTVNYAGNLTFPVKYYNNTVVLEFTPDNANNASLPPFMTTGNSADQVDVTLENNVFHAPNWIPASTAFAPLGTGPLSGFQLRHKGAKWNFPMVEGTAGSFSGGVEVPDGSFISVPYPDDRPTNPVAPGSSIAIRNPAGTITDQAYFQNRTSTFDQISIGNTAYNSARGQIVVNPGPSSISIQNKTGFTWAVGTFLRILFDRSDYLMDFVPDTIPASTAVPLASPEPTSSALGAVTAPANKPYDDFFLAIRPPTWDAGAFEET